MTDVAAADCECTHGSMGGPCSLCHHPHPIGEPCGLYRRMRKGVTILGVCGKAGSGKDTVADILVKEHGWAKVALADPLKRICRDVYSFTFDQLWGPSSSRNAPDKRFPREHGPWTKDQKCMCCGANITNVDVCYLTPRHALQQLGTEWGRRCYPDVWVDYALRVADKLLFHLKDGRTHDYDKYRRHNYNPQVGLFERAGNDSDASHGERIEGVVISDIRFPNEVLAVHGKGGRIWRATHGDGLTTTAGAHESESYFDSLKADMMVPDSTLEALPGVIAGMLSHTHRGARQAP